VTDCKPQLVTQLFDGLLGVSRAWLERSPPRRHALPICGGYRHLPIKSNVSRHWSGTLSQPCREARATRRR